jgi:hypothetical protein
VTADEGLVAVVAQPMASTLQLFYRGEAAELSNGRRRSGGGGLWGAPRWDRHWW